SLLMLFAMVAVCQENSKVLIGMAFSRHEVRRDEASYSLGYRHVKGAIEVSGVRWEDSRLLFGSDADDLHEAIPPQLAEAAIQALHSSDGEPWDRSCIMVLGWPVPLVNSQLRVRFAPTQTGTTMISEESAAVPLTLGRRRYSIPMTPTREGLAAALLLTAVNGLLVYGCVGKVERSYIAIRTRRHLRIAASGRCPACRYPCPPDTTICPECGSTLIAQRT
ncbi:MAG: zinc ribbon domain-containing protein, partial [Planctomycetota bacterium]|nr:zinc ribbon domain-containing protein [Planctomycetota bacterium]